jgi:hypothetical protein
LYREINLTSAIKISKEESGFSSTLIDQPLEVQRKTASGNIDTSLFDSAIASGITDKTVMNLAGIFAWDVDFVLDIRRGDSYYILYEELYQDDEYVGDGEVIAAEFNNNGRTIQAIRYIDKDGRSDYFTPEGQSVRKAFLRSPSIQAGAIQCSKLFARIAGQITRHHVVRRSKHLVTARLFSAA